MTDTRESVVLSYVDLLYAVPVAVLGTRLAEVDLSQVTAAGWGDVALALTAISLGWVGHHTNRKRVPASARVRATRRPFTTAQFPQFVVEILIIATYFALVALAALAGAPSRGSASELPKAAWLAEAFGLYLAWDALDIRIATTLAGSTAPDSAETRWVRRATRGARVTLGFQVLFALVLLLPWTRRHHGRAAVIAFDAVAIVVLYAYRAIQERVCREDDDQLADEGLRERTRKEPSAARGSSPLHGIDHAGTGERPE